MNIQSVYLPLYHNREKKNSFIAESLGSRIGFIRLKFE
jgi:hypothetical protein